ncbi:MAG TPA: hypothetical protein VKJ45_22650 [Blastocatellia bacterium]|nr:hypothetical protein [Blastocatellia bacterium]
MSRRKVDRRPGKQRASAHWRENKMVDGFVTNGCNATRTLRREEVLDAISDVSPGAAKYFHLLPQPEEAGSSG